MPSHANRIKRCKEKLTENNETENVGEPVDKPIKKKKTDNKNRGKKYVKPVRTLSGVIFGYWTN